MTLKERLYTMPSMAVLPIMILFFSSLHCEIPGIEIGKVRAEERARLVLLGSRCGGCGLLLFGGRRRRLVTASRRVGFVRSTRGRGESAGTSAS